MAIEPISSVSQRPDAMMPRRRPQAVDQQAADTSVRSEPAAQVRGQMPDRRLAQVMQAGRETSALLSTLSGPREGIFQAPSPLSTNQTQAARAQTGAPQRAVAAQVDRGPVPGWNRLADGDEHRPPCLVGGVGEG